MPSDLASLVDTMIDQAAGADRPVLIDPAGPWSRATLDRAAESTRRGLAGAGLGPDEPVLVALGNDGRDLAALLGTWRAGGVAVPLHRASPEAVRQRLAATAGARLMVAAPGAVLDLERSARFRPELRGAALVLFTSGSTGAAKGVVLGHRRLVGKLAAIDRELGFGPHSRSLLVLQLGFIFGLWLSLVTLSRGGTVELAGRFDAAAVIQRLAAGDITDIGVVPTMMRLLLNQHSAGPLPAGLRTLTGGEPLGPGLARRWRALAPGALVDIYGLTETGSSDLFAPDADGTALGHSALGSEWRIAGQTEPPVAGSSGELQIRSAFGMCGYLDAPELTAAAFDDGWFRTGDLARLRPDGRPELIGRVKEIINRGGLKVAPLELDRALAEHPDIAEALTTGVADPLRGERIHALVVPRPGRSLDPRALTAWLGDRLDHYKLPDHIHVAAALPLGGTGKASRSALRQWLEEAGKDSA